MAPPLTQKEGANISFGPLLSVFFLRNDPFIHDWFHFHRPQGQTSPFLFKHDNGRVKPSSKPEFFSFFSFFLFSLYAALTFICFACRAGRKKYTSSRPAFPMAFLLLTIIEIIQVFCFISFCSDITAHLVVVEVAVLQRRRFSTYTTTQRTLELLVNCSFCERLRISCFLLIFARTV